MRTQRVGSIELDPAALDADLARLPELHLVQPYQEFVCGWPSRSVMLLAPGGETGDGVIAHYDESAPAAVTDQGRLVPYVASLLEDPRYRPHLRFARLAVLASNVLVPHRDYVEFDGAPAASRPSLRLHVPLRTNPGCLFCDENTVFRMRVGEVWVLDVSRVHGAAALSPEMRVHLILDLADVDPAGLGMDGTAGIPEDSVVPRPPLPEAERLALQDLARVVDLDNLQDVFGIIAKKQYLYDGGDDFFWQIVGGIAKEVADPAMAARLAELETHFVLSRAE
jgi:hypothetical protein